MADPDAIAVLSIGKGQFWCDSEGTPYAWQWTLTRPGAWSVYAQVVLPRTANGGATDELRRVLGLSSRVERLRAEQIATAGGGGLVAEQIEQELREAGRWFAEYGLGTTVSTALAHAMPQALELRLPAELAAFETLPWETALVAGRSLAEHGVSIVRAVGGARPAEVPAPAPPLRVLAVFSLSQRRDAVDFGSHRVALRAQMRRYGRDGLPLELVSRQFGTTRQTLSELAGRDGGWDVVHITAHGRPGALLLAGEDGRPDPVPAAQLATLLAALRGRVRLIVLSSCWSGGQHTPEVAAPEGQPAEATPAGPASAGLTSVGLTSVGAELSAALGCAVLAMRFPVGVAFALRFSTLLYEALLGQEGAPLPAAAQQALALSVADPDLPERRIPRLAAGTPLLFGAAATSLRLPDRPLGPYPDLVPGTDLLPDWPASFVGRQQSATEAAAHLAPGAGSAGVLIRGRRGQGSTTCATLLAHDHADAFAHVAWYPQPASAYGSRADGYLALAAYLDFLVREVPPLADAARRHGPDAAARGIAERLRDGPRLLLVIDGVDRLLTADASWAGFLTVLVGGPAGGTPPAAGRVLLTSRRSLPGSPLPEVVLSALTEEEAWALGMASPALARAAVHDAELVRRLVRERARCVPGLIGELAEAAAEASSADDLQAWYPGDRGVSG